MGQKQWKGVSYDPDGAVKSCLFCRIAQKRMNPGRDGKGELLYEDEDVVVFKPREPMATMHILAVPKRHIKTVRNLTDQELLKKMLIAGSFVLDREESSDCAVGKQKSVTDILRDPRRYYRFHVPPFNSIDHVHLHCFKRPFLSWYNALKYTDNGIWSESAASVWSAL